MFIILVVVLFITTSVMVCLALAASRPAVTWRKCPECLRYHRNGSIRYLYPFVADPEWEHCPDCNSKKFKLPTLPSL